MHELLHICPRDAWVAAKDDALYVASSLEAEGFIHCSTREQVLLPANAMFAGRTDLVILVIDADALEAAVVYEDCYDTGIAFPHVYGPIETSSVVRVVSFPCDADGTFRLPVDL